MTHRVLVVDDDRAVRTVLRVNLTKKGGLELTVASGVQEALGELRSQAFDLVLTDVQMQDGTGLDLLEQVKSSWPDTEVVVMTGYGSVGDAVRAMKSGAADYIIKPVERDELYVILDRALENRALRAELVQLRQEVNERYGFDNIIGTTAAMLRVYEDIDAVAGSSATVLLHGPTGTGKELLAHALHYRSKRATRPFIRVNCAAIPEALLESELFGHEKGSFTGAIRQHRGKFEQADGGTIFLDEIGEITAPMQSKLLRVLESGEFPRVGGSETLHVQVRVVAATNRDLLEEVRERRFREDLYYRLNVVAIRVPSLSERREDIPLLVDHFVRRYAEANERPVPRVPRHSLEALVAYDWPGNVRQLEHTVERAVILSRDPEVLELMPPVEPGARPSRGGAVAPLLPEAGTSLADAVRQYERRVLIGALKAAGGVQTTVAKQLGLSTSNLSYRLKKLGIRAKDLA